MLCIFVCAQTNAVHNATFMLVSIFVLCAPCQSDFLYQLDLASRTAAAYEKRTISAKQLKRANRAVLLDCATPYTDKQVKKVSALCVIWHHSFFLQL